MSIYRDGKIYLYGLVGNYPGEDSFTAIEVVDALQRHGQRKPVDVLINSAGGYTDDGIAIFNVLANHGGRVTVYVDAMAASSASLLAMAADEIVMRAGSLMMIHSAWNPSGGNEADHTKAADRLRLLDGVMAEIYAAKCRKPVAVVREMMRLETWFTPEEAVAQGFADRVDRAQAMTFARFDYTAYAHAPRALAAASVPRAPATPKVTLASDMRRRAGLTGAK